MVSETSPLDPPCIELSHYGMNLTFGVLNIHKIDSNNNRLPGDLNIGALSSNGIITSTTTNGSGWNGWNIILDIVNGSHGAIRNTTGNILFGLHNTGVFYWGSMNTNTYTMILDHGGTLTLSGNLIIQGGALLSTGVLNITGPNNGSFGSAYINANFNPYGQNQFSLGNGNSPWLNVVCQTLDYYNQSWGYYDAYDDMAIIKGITQKTITVNGNSKQIVDPESLKLFNADPNSTDSNIVNYTDMGKIIGFMLCVHKKSAIKLDEHDANLLTINDKLEQQDTNINEALKLKDDIAELQDQINQLKAKVAS